MNELLAVLKDASAALLDGSDRVLRPLKNSSPLPRSGGVVALFVTHELSVHIPKLFTAAMSSSTSALSAGQLRIA
jgi:hypothetical protein